MKFHTKTLVGAGLLLAGLVIVYRHVFERLIDAWIVDGNYSHGFLIIPLAAYFAWERRDRLATTPLRPHWFGLVLFFGGVAILLAGLYASELFLTRVSLLPVVVGMLVFLVGWEHVRILSFPLAFLLLMIPIPAIILNQITFPLQLLASRVGETAISAANIPVLREGNVLVLANTSLEVAEACSGIRSLVSLITLGLVYGYFTDPRGWVRTVLVASTIPVAIFANGARVAGTGIAAHYFGPSVAEGFLHEFSGWMVFVVAFVMILVVHKTVSKVAPPPPVSAAVA